MKTNIYLTVIIALLSMIGISCKNDTVRNAADLNYVDAVNIGSTQIFLYVERPDNLEIIVPFSTFLDFSRFDLTNVREGTLKIRTGSSGKGGKIVWDAVPLDLEAYNYDKLLLAWRNSESVSHLVIHTPPETTVVDTDWTGTDTINLYDLVAGIDFELQGWDSMNVAEDMIFSIWGLKSTFGTKDYMELFYGPTEYGHYRISFIKSAYSATSTMEKRGLAWVDENPDSTGFMINLEASDDSIFERILSDCAEAIFRYSLKDKSLLGDELDYDLAFIDSCALPNIKK